MPLDVCWRIKAERVDMSVRMLLQGIIVWQVYGADVLWRMSKNSCVPVMHVNELANQGA
jgi:hypothetical protein